MFQIIKQILILDNDNPSKYKMQVLNDDLIYWGNKAIQTYLEKVIAPPL